MEKGAQQKTAAELTGRKLLGRHKCLVWRVSNVFSLVRYLTDERNDEGESGEQLSEKHPPWQHPFPAVA
jgi:hypothetical protein